MAPIFLSGLVIGACTDAAGGPRWSSARDAGRLSGLTAPYTFVVMGDSRSGDKVYAGLVGMIAGAGPDFVINTGDAIPDPGDEDDWARFIELSSPLEMPYFIAPGNHDIGDTKSEAVFRDVVEQPGNELYYSFTAGGSLFVVLDTEEPRYEARIAGEQLEWLKGVLSGEAARFKFVFLHRPMYSGDDAGKHRGRSLDKYPEERDRLQGLFEEAGVDAVFAGHEHLYLRKQVGTVTHVITGGTGAPLYTEEEKGGFHHFIKITVSDDAARAVVVDMDGNVRDEFEIKR